MSLYKKADSDDVKIGVLQNVTIDNTEYLFSLGMGNNIYAELYDLNNQVLLSKKLATSLLSTSKIYNIRGAASYLVVSGTNYIIFPFIDSSEDFYIKRIYFSSTNIVSNSPALKSYSVSSRGRVRIARHGWHPV